MRITDSRYDRDRLRLAIAYRMIALEARTRTIRLATQLSDDRIRRMYRDYFATLGGNRVRRRRGKSPRQMSFFRRSLEHEQQAALLGALLQLCGLLAAYPAGFRPVLEDVGPLLRRLRDLPRTLARRAHHVRARLAPVAGVLPQRRDRAVAVPGLRRLRGCGTRSRYFPTIARHAGAVPQPTVEQGDGRRAR